MSNRDSTGKHQSSNLKYGNSNRESSKIERFFHTCTQQEEKITDHLVSRQFPEVFVLDNLYYWNVQPYRLPAVETQQEDTVVDDSLLFASDVLLFASFSPRSSGVYQA